MFRNGRQLVRLINQLLDFSKLESGRMSLKTKEIKINLLTDLPEVPNNEH